jgi:hypothetical protein
LKPFSGFASLIFFLEAVQKDEAMNNKLSFCKLMTPPNLSKEQELPPGF